MAPAVPTPPQTGNKNKTWSEVSNGKASWISVVVALGLSGEAGHRPRGPVWTRAGGRVCAAPTPQKHAEGRRVMRRLTLPLGPPSPHHPHPRAMQS